MIPPHEESSAPRLWRAFLARGLGQPHRSSTSLRAGGFFSWRRETETVAASPTDAGDTVCGDDDDDGLYHDRRRLTFPDAMPNLRGNCYSRNPKSLTV